MRHGLHNMRIQASLTAAAINLKRLAALLVLLQFGARIAVCPSPRPLAAA
jgi:hypothetical protein